MAKLNKMQAQAIISKLGREYRLLRKSIIDDKYKNYTLSDNAKELRRLFEAKEAAREAADAAEDATKEFAKSLGLNGIYGYTKTEEALNQLKKRELEDSIPDIDLDAALDDLIIESVDDDFNVDKFIEHYLKQIRNG